MPKKRKQKKNIAQDVTINECANASKPVTRVKKSAPSGSTSTPEVSWDQIQDDDCDIIEEMDAGGVKRFICKKKRNSKTKKVEEEPGTEYPEVIWYLISHFVHPEDVGRFAAINRTTYAITKRESFWRGLYKRYCQDHPKLPELLRLENNDKVYGIKQRVIRALYHTHSVFINRVAKQASQDSKPHQLVKHKCVNVWFGKGATYWCVYFKFRKFDTLHRFKKPEVDFLQELGRVDANPEEGSRLLEITCQFFNEVPPLMGMTLSSVNVSLSRGFLHHKIHLGFNTSYHVSRNIQPECSLVLDTVKRIFVCDWWHPNYPHFDTSLPLSDGYDSSLPVLKYDFFMPDDD